MAVKKIHDTRWMVYYRRAGKLIKEYFRGPEAEALARQRDIEVKIRPAQTGTTPTGPTFEELSKIYIEARGFSENSLKHLCIRLDANILPVIGHRKSISITMDDMDQYVRIRRSDGVRDSTIRREITDIKAILSFAASRRPPEIPFNPLRDYRAPKSDDDVIVPPTSEELTAILAVASPHIERFILLACHLGCRPGSVELLSLKWSDVLWPTRSIRITSAKKGGPQIRNVPIHSGIIEKLQTWENIDREKFGELKLKHVPIIHYHGQSVKRIGKAWALTLARAGISRRIRPYDMRHRFVTVALEAHADPHALADVVGSRPETLMRHYQHITRAIHVRTVESVPAIGGPDSQHHDID